MKTSTKLFQAIIDSLPVHLYWTDKNTRIVGANISQAKNFGDKDIASCIGKNSYDFAKQMGWTKKFVDQLHREHLAVIKEGKGKVTEYTGILADGKEYTFLSHKYPLIVDDETVGLVGISVDITNRKKTEEELQKAKKQAEIVNQLKTQFITNMEHDLKIPPGSIASLLEQIAEQEQSSKYEEQLESASKAADQLIMLLNNILDFNHVDYVHFPVFEKKFNIKKSIQNVIQLEIPAALNKNLKLVVNLDKDIPKSIISDDFRINLILVNLVNNAIKFTQEGFVRVSAEVTEYIDRKNGILKITIEDSGIGIPIEERNLMYKKFSRGTSANEGIHRGMGLGLYIVKQFIKDIGGKIEAQSKVGFGSTFTCIIPFRIPLAMSKCSS